MIPDDSDKKKPLKNLTDRFSIMNEKPRQVNGEIVVELLLWDFSNNDI